MSPPKQLRQQTSNCSSLLIYQPQKDGRLSWPSWLTYSGRLTHTSGHPSATSLDGVVPSWMVGVFASVNLPLHYKVQKFSSGTGSPRWSRKKGRKTVVVWWCGVIVMFNFKCLGVSILYTTITVKICHAFSFFCPGDLDL